jgi:hypothetical protein
LPRKTDLARIKAKRVRNGQWLKHHEMQLKEAADAALQRRSVHRWLTSIAHCSSARLMCRKHVTPARMHFIGAKAEKTRRHRVGNKGHHQHRDETAVLHGRLDLRYAGRLSAIE